MHFDAMYSRAAARIARKHRADLFLYSPYAMPPSANATSIARSRYFSSSIRIRDSSV
jgi:hypothetical protein